MSDTRRETRNELQASVILRCVNGVEERGMIRNISESGLFVETNRPERINSCLVVGLAAPDSTAGYPFRFGALVAHRQDDGVGLMLPEGAAYVINNLCAVSGQPERAVAG